MENLTLQTDILLLEGLKVTPQSAAPAFILLLLIYIFIMMANLGLVVLISMETSLHQPMYLLFCNMSVNDAFGASTIIPRILQDIFQSQRYIYYADCVFQAFSWGVNLVLVLILIGLTVRLSRCRKVIFNPFCDNASLFKLSCESVLINNIYGLAYTVVLLSSSLGSVTLTYARIAISCLSNKNGALNSKALQTCATHLLMYIIMFASGCVIIFLHRFPHLSDQRKVASIMFHVVPPAMNAIIYGLQIKAVRQKIFIFISQT
uniref:G-protein coupled receptors family 1 profile domain-containing protein n=1 Tax=Sphaeramia orbicularis TaxID=375764 RepID=A0A672YCS3_9TELE